MNFKKQKANMLSLFIFIFISSTPTVLPAQEISASPQPESGKITETNESGNNSQGIIPPAIQKNTDATAEVPEPEQNTVVQKSQSSSQGFFSKEYLDLSINSDFAIDNHGVYMGASGHIGLFFPKTLGLRLKMGILVNTLKSGDTGAILYPEISTLIFYKHDAQKTKGFKRYIKFSIELLAFLGRSGGDAPSLEASPAAVAGVGIMWKPYRFLGFNLEISGHAYSPQDYNNSGFLVIATAGISLHF